MLRAMQWPRATLLAWLLISFAIGASCNGDQEGSHASSEDVTSGDSSDEGEASPSTKKAKQGAAADRERIEELDAVDLSMLSETGRERWVKVANQQLSPCGDPVNVARCVAEDRDCKECVTAARYLARLVSEGYDAGTIAEHYRLRYSDETKHDIDTKGSPVRGSPMAPVTIVEFSDFQCPHCAAAYPVLERIVSESDGKVKLVFKHYPLSHHTHARKAARAAVAAGEQDKFWEMHDKLFENQLALTGADLEGYAKELGLDMERFKEDMASEEIEACIEADREEAERLGVEGTPAMFVNGRRYPEAPRSLPAYIEEELE